MRAFLSGLAVLLCGFLLTGAMGLNAPIMQSQNYYINDHAGVIEKENRDSMLQTAQELYNNTGVRAVLLTVEKLDGRSPEEYAELIFKAWEIEAGAIGILVLLSTEERRFAAWPNTDVSLTHSIAAADKLAQAEQFDLAATVCYASIVDSIYNRYATDVTRSEASKPETVHSEASVTDRQEPQISQDTAITQSTEDTDKPETTKSTFTLLILLFFILFSMRMRRVASKRRKRMVHNNAYYLRTTYLRKEPVAVREDDVDYPSGFGGLGNRKAIYFEDVDADDDIGIIKRRSDDLSDSEESDHNGVAT